MSCSVVIRSLLLVCALAATHAVCLRAPAPVTRAAARARQQQHSLGAPHTLAHYHQAAQKERQPVGANFKWGANGHTLIASVAAALVNSSVLQQAEQMAGDTLANIAAWADEIKFKYPWSSALHYINVPDNTCSYSRADDCHDEKGHNLACVDYAIVNYTARAADSSLSSAERQFAVRMVVHLVGDVHQPLHVGWTSDEGGNKQKGSYASHHEVTLHSLWDTYLLNTRVQDDFHNQWALYTKFILQQIQSGAYEGNVTEWKTCAHSAEYNACSEEWANESVYDACNYAYVDENGNAIENGFSLGDAYYEIAKPIFDAQLAKAAVRLANVLESMFS